LPIRRRKVDSLLGEPLSEHEREVPGLIAAGLSHVEIAERLFIGENTVKQHIRHLHGKLNVTSRTHAILRARELRLRQEFLT
jgi:ATP/maltotriose-dependent transcriptional regulator MalT